MYSCIYVCRLGEAEKAMYHYKHAGAESDPDVMTRARNLQFHLNKCTEAKKQRDWNTLLRETGLSISAGADSAPQVSPHGHAHGYGHPYGDFT